MQGSIAFDRVECRQLSPTELNRSFVDTIPKNGNRLPDVGPRADGTSPEIQRPRASCFELIPRHADRNMGVKY